MAYTITCPKCLTEKISEKHRDDFFNVRYYNCENHECIIQTFEVNFNTKVVDYKSGLKPENNSDQFEVLYQSIINEECVLCLGPNIFDIDEDLSFEEAFANQLKSKESKLHITAYQNGLLNHNHVANITDIHRDIRKFFSLQSEKRLSRIILKKLSYIPFHFYISLTPDKSLLKCLDTIDREYAYFNRANGVSYGEDDLPYGGQIPKKDNPLIYNLLGDIDKIGSLIYTYDDIYQFLQAIADKDIPNRLKSKLNDSAQFVLLGIPYEMWYTHLFLRVLGFHTDNQRKSKVAAGFRINEEIVKIYHEQYYVKFFSDTEITRKFVSKLFEYFRRKDAENIHNPQLRTVDISLGINLIENGKIFEMCNYVNKQLKKILDNLKSNEENISFTKSSFLDLEGIKNKIDNIHKIKSNPSEQNIHEQYAIETIKELGVILDNETDDGLFEA